MAQVDQTQNFPFFPVPGIEPPPAYSNTVMMFYGPADVTLSFYQSAASTNPEDPGGAPVIANSPVARVVMSPQQTKTLFYILRANLAQWEAQFGMITVSPDVRTALGITEEDG